MSQATVSHVPELLQRPAAGEDPAKRRQIIEGARHVFGTMGFDAASMNDVTRHAGVSKSTLYVYFRSKEELFTALVAEERGHYFEKVRKIFTDPRDPVGTLRTYGLLLVTMLTSEPVVRANRTVIAVADRMPEIGHDFFEQGPRRTIRLLADYIAAANAIGTLAAPDPQVAGIQFTELALASLFRRRLYNHLATEPSAAEIAGNVEGAVRLFMAGYGPSAPRACEAPGLPSPRAALAGEARDQIL